MFIIHLEGFSQIVKFTDKLITDVSARYLLYNSLNKNGKIISNFGN